MAAMSVRVKVFGCVARRSHRLRRETEAGRCDRDPRRLPDDDPRVPYDAELDSAGRPGDWRRRPGRQGRVEVTGRLLASRVRLRHFRSREEFVDCV